MEEEEKEEELTEVEKMLREMENDAIIIETEDMKADPMSSAYNVTDMFNPENALSRTPCTERKYEKTTVKDDFKRWLEKSLREVGIPQEKITEILQKEVPAGVEHTYTDLVKELFKAKKESRDYEKGRWKKIDEL